MDRLNRVLSQEGVSYFTAIPLSWRPEAELSDGDIAVWMYGNVTLLRALATIESIQPELDGDLGSGVGKVLERLEFKIDLTLSLVAKLLTQHAVRPSTCPVFVSAEGIEWISKEAAMEGDNIVLSAYISPKLPQPLVLPAKIKSVQSESGGTRIYATFTHLSEEAQDWLSRTVFRYHRREVQQHSR
ncbi:MAG: PilZ domain-containing protein [Gammaproteobacteria bacterium]|nr:PilZ domain-containing protein [Gammaproteobacteria bacterium]MBU1979024.1 PilZ domain-containing protein [Gammaproteobacteria bacterium]